MCGIAGILSLNQSLQEKIHDMLRLQHHRGPDFTGTYFNSGVALGHNRLAIISLEESSNQPMTSSETDHVLVFNGEIYNYIELRKELSQSYRFKTNSDSEVILAAYLKWGKECLHKLNGMFAFAIWDPLAKKLFAARDRFGVKPFYYATNDEGFYFASEIKTLHQVVEKRVNETTWAGYLSQATYGGREDTFWSGIHELPAGCCLEWSDASFDISVWYDFIERVQNRSYPSAIESIQSEYEELLDNAIELRFRADVPIGFNLSGGLDSSTLLALVNKQKNTADIEAYTFYSDNEAYDELPWVELMLKDYKHPLRKSLVLANEIPEQAAYLQHIQDEPFGGIPTIAYSKIFKDARKNGTLVLLDGQGMDEAWAGYDYYTNDSSSVVQGIKTGGPCRINTLNEDFLKLVREQQQAPQPFDNRVQNLQYRDLFYTKIPRALRFNDRNSMAHSTELREPFLDFRLVEYAFGLPNDLKIKDGQRKWMLRNIAAQYLKNDISLAPKRALQTPQREWLTDELRGFVEDCTAQIKQSQFSEWFNWDELEIEKKRFFSGNNDNSFYVWQWVSVALLST